MTEPLQQDAVSVARLRVRGGRAACTRARRAIEAASWPDVPRDRWVLVRRVRVRASASAVGRRLSAETRRLLDAGSGDDVVRFADYGELLAALLGDLADGRAPERWYWQHWRRWFERPLSPAIAGLLSEDTLWLAAVSERLRQRGQLSRVWCALNAGDASALLERYAERAGFSRAWHEGTAHGAAASGDVATPSPAQRACWAPIVGHLPPDDARRQLALLLVAQQLAPLALQHAPRALIARLSCCFDAPPAHASASTSQAAPPADRGHGDRQLPPSELTGGRALAPGPMSPSGTASPVAASGRCEPAELDLGPSRARAMSGSAVPSRRDTAPAGSADLDTAPAARATDELRAASPSTGSDARAESDALLELRPRLDPGSKPANVPSPGSRHPRPARAGQVRLEPQQRAIDTLVSEQAGLFYLVNFLNRSEPQRLMRERWREVPNGWHWLVGVGRELGLAPSDPLSAFLARQSGFESVEELARIVLPARDELLGWARRWYGPAGLWQPELLGWRATLRATPTHCDVHARLDSVRLPVRLHGLDVDPGWVPWLGRVVVFHYE